MKDRCMLPIVRVSGKPYEMGEQIGSECSARARAYRKAMGESVLHSTGMTWKKAVTRSKLYLPFAEEFYPDYVEEIRGYAAGAGLPFQDAFSLCCHELLSPLGFRGCTDVVVSDAASFEGDVLVGHNEDWSMGQLGSVVLLHARPRGKPEFISTSYAGIVPSSGMNNRGISITGNALNPNDVRVGIPKLFPVRMVLESKTIGDAMEAALPKARASSYNNICSDRSGEIFSLEGSATDFAVIYASDGYLVHTNHYTADKMRRFESDPDSTSCSVFRYNRALRLVQGQLGAVTVDSLISIFRDHVSTPGSICRHADPGTHPLDVSETIFSVIYDLTRLRAHVCKGKPCDGCYGTFQLGR